MKTFCKFLTYTALFVFASGCCQLCTYRGKHVGYQTAANMEAIGMKVDCPPCVFEKQIAHLETISGNLETTDVNRRLAEQQIRVLRTRIQEHYFDKNNEPRR